MDNNLFHINVFLDIDKTNAFVREKIKDGSLTTDTVLSADMFDWETRIENGEIPVFPVQLKIG